MKKRGITSMKIIDLLNEDKVTLSQTVDKLNVNL